MKRLTTILAALALAFALVTPRANAQTAPGTFLGVYTSYLCGSVTAEFTNAPWCFNPQNGVLYSSKGPTSPYRQFMGISQIDMGGANAVVSTSVVNIFPLQGIDTAVAAAAEGDVLSVEREVENYSGLQCALYTAGGTLTVAGGTSYVLALRQNGSASALTCTIAATASSCVDTTHTVTTAVLDKLDFMDTPSGTPTALIPKCTVIEQH